MGGACGQAEELRGQGVGRRLIGSFNVSAAGAAPKHTAEEREREREGEWARGRGAHFC